MQLPASPHRVATGDRGKSSMTANESLINYPRFRQDMAFLKTSEGVLVKAQD